MTKSSTSNSVEYEVPSDWRGETISRIRALMKEADPDIVEDVKWKTRTNPGGVLVWYHDGIISTGEIYKKHLRLSLAKGNELKDQDPKGLINSYRAILLHEEDTLDEAAFKNLIRVAVAFNVNKKEEKDTQEK